MASVIMFHWQDGEVDIEFHAKDSTITEIH